MARINYRTEDLRALLALSQTLSFVKGAALLHITQSAFSRRISQLESALGASLVERSTRNVAFTALGLEVVRDAAPLLAALDEAMLEVGRRSRGESGRIAISCLTTVAYTLLPSVLEQFRALYPNVRLQLLDDTGRRVTASVLQREAEFGISVLGASIAGLYADHVADDPYVIAFSPGHELQKQREVQWSELAPWHPVALRSTSANRQQIDDALSAAGIAPPWFDEVEHLSSMLGLLRGSAVIGVLPKLALAAGASELQTRRLVKPSIVRRIGLIRRQDSQLSAPAQTLWDLLASALKQVGTDQVRVGKDLKKRTDQVLAATGLKPR